MLQHRTPNPLSGAVPLRVEWHPVLQSEICQSIRRLNKILLLLRDHPEGIAVNELARRLGVHRATIHRYMQDLVSE